MDPVAWGQGDGAIITPSFAYGFATSIHGNLYHLEGQKLLYSAGQFLAIMGTEDGKVSFIPTHSSVKAVKGLRAANNKKYLAAVEETYDADQQQVSVYNVPAEKRMRTLMLERQHTQANTVVGISFSGDGKLLMIAAGEPDYTVLLWRWHTNKLMMTVSPECQVSCAALNPWDESCLAVASTHMVRSYKLDPAGTTAKPNNHLQLDHNGDTVVTCLVHLVGGLLAVGTNTGKVMVFSDVGIVSSLEISAADPDSGRAAHQADPAAQQSPSAASRPSAVANSRQGMSLISGSGQAPRPAPASATRNAVQALVQRGRGFVAAGSNWDVYLFEPPAATTKRTGTTETYTLSRRLSFASLIAKPCSPSTLSLSSSGSNGSGVAGSNSSMADCKVVGLSVSITDDHLAVATATGKLLLLGLTSALQALQEAEDAAAAVSANRNGITSGDAVHKQGDAPAGAATDNPSSAEDSSVAAEGNLALVENVQDEAEPDPAGWQVLCAGFPSARVVGLDACQHLPLLLVVSEDKWVRVWDWVRRTRVAARYLASEQPLCCALHPSGFMAALGTIEGLKLYYVMRREMTPITDLPVAKCSVVRYSHGGSVLAAVGRSNAIVIYPAYYGGGAGASGVNPSQWHSNTSTYYTQHSNSGDCKGAGDGPAVGSEGACIMRPLWVLKAHVSTVTDLVFSGDDKRLVSSGAGGAVYFWDLATGSRLMELEYVDKKSVYYAACHHDRTAAAVVRTMDGRLQHLQDGRLVFEVAGLGTDASPMALTGDGRVLLAGTNRGSVISIPWPKDPEGVGQQQQQLREAAGLAAASQQDYVQGFLLDDARSPPMPSGPHAYVHAGLMKHLSVQVETGGAVSPRSSAMTPGSAAGKTPGTVPAARTPQSTKTPHGHNAGRTSATSSPSHAHNGQQQGLSGAHQEQQHQQDAALQSDDVSAGSNAATQSHQGFKEYRLHAARITAIKVLHTSGLMFTASADGLVMMSSLTLVLDGILTDPPALALPPSATVASAAAATAAQLAMGTNPTPTAIGLAAGIDAVVVPGAVPGLPLPVTLVDEGLVLALKERIRSMAMQVVGIRKDAQYQVLRQTQALRESLGTSDSQAAALQKELAALQKALIDNQAAADASQQQAVRELEALHVAAAEQLEGLYEARLALEAERMAQLVAARDDLELSLKEEMKRRSAASEQLLAEVHAMYRQQLADEAVKAESAAATAAGDAALWQQVLLQTEEELEQQAEKDSEQLANVQHRAGETEMKLKAEVHIINRTNARLKADKAADTAKINEITKQLEGQNAKLAEAAASADKLRRELAERDGVIAENYQTLQGLRRRVQELETHKFVLTYKADAAAAELQPKDEQITAMQQALDSQDRELIGGHSALLAAQRAVTEKNAAVASAKQELWEARQTLTHQSGLLDAVAHDIFQVLQQPDERVAGGRTARRQALEALAVKYCTNRGGGPRSSVQVEQEMMAHIAAAEKKSRLLEGHLKQAVDSNKRNSRHLMADNTALLADLAEMAHTNRDLGRQLTAATNKLAQFGLRLSGTNITRLTGQDGGQRGVLPAADECSNSSSAQPANLAEVSTRETNSRAGTAAGERGAYAAAGSNGTRPGSPALGHSLRSQGGSSLGGKLLPGSTGRVLSSTLQQQQAELDELNAVLASTANVVANQAAQIQRLQEIAGASQQMQQAEGVDTGQNKGVSKQDPTEVALSAIERKAAALGAGSYASSGVRFARGLAAMYDLRDDGGGSAATAAAAAAPSAWRAPGELNNSTANAISRPATAGPDARPRSRGRCAAASSAAAVSAAASRPRSASTGRCRPSTASEGVIAHGVLAGTTPTPAAVGCGRHVALGGGLHSGRHSPSLSVPKRRPSPAGGVGMHACLRSDLEAWRAK